MNILLCEHPIPVAKLIGNVDDRIVGTDAAESARHAVAQINWALATIERCIATRRKRQAFAAVVSNARSMFLDADAIRAGAENGTFYSNAALMVRSSLRGAPEVVKALRYAWQTVLAAEPTRVLSQVAYATMLRKLYLTLKIDEGNVRIDATQCVRATRVDWPRDSRGCHELSETAFCQSWFELVDLWCDCVGACDYAAWLRRAAERITTCRDGDKTCRCWRGDAELLDVLCTKVRLPLAARRSAGGGAPLQSSRSCDACSRLSVALRGVGACVWRG